MKQTYRQRGPFLTFVFVAVAYLAIFMTLVILAECRPRPASTLKSATTKYAPE